MVLVNIGENLEQVDQVSFSRQRQMGQYHGHFQTDIYSSQLNNTTHYSNEGLKVCSFRGFELMGDVELWMVWCFEGNIIFFR